MRCSACAMREHGATDFVPRSPVGACHAGWAWHPLDGTDMLPGGRSTVTGHSCLVLCVFKQCGSETDRNLLRDLTELG